MTATTFKQTLKQRLKTARIFYVCRDWERACFSRKLPENFIIITNQVPKMPTEKNIIAIKNKEILDTSEILKLPTVKELITDKDFVLVFKNTKQIEKICIDNGWQLLNPPAEFSGEIEEKIQQIKWLGELKKYLPLTKITTIKNIKWQNKKFILQFNHGHSGIGTILIDEENKLTELKIKFPDRKVRTSEFIDGPTFTNNNVVWGKKIFTGNVSYQITGIHPFTENPFTTIGNDWTMVDKILTAKQKKQYLIIAIAIGKRLMKYGWQGLYGVDIVFGKNKAYLIEINARQPASASYESILQKTNSIFEAHLGSLLQMSNIGFNLTKINHGAQIIKRLNNSSLNPTIKKQLSAQATSIIYYKNTKTETEEMKWQFNDKVISNILNKNQLL